MSGFVAKEVVVSTMSQLYGGEEPPDGTTPGFVDDLREIGSSFLSASWDTVRAVPGVFGLDFTEVEDETSTAVDDRIRASFESSGGGSGALAALAFMVFVLLYTPCMAAVAAFRAEFGTKWMLIQVVGQLAIAWLAALIVFQAGRMLGF
jgi:ferrous iron transport protein B